MEKLNYFQKRKISLGLMLLATMIWGMGFIAQSEGAKHAPPFFFNAVRFWIGALAICPLAVFRAYKSTGKISFWTDAPHDNKQMIFKGALIDGVVLFSGMTLQQIGIAYSTPSKAGFLVALSIVFVPLIRSFLGEKVKFFQWIGVITSMIGVALLTVSEELHINYGDILLIAASAFFALNTIVSGYYNKLVESFKYTLFRFIFAAAFCTVISFFTETVNKTMIIGALPSILFAGILSSGIAFSLQSFAQIHLDDLSIALTLSMESVFAAIFAWAIVGDVLSIREILGCAIIFISVIYIQIKEGKEVEVTKII